MAPMPIPWVDSDPGRILLLHARAIPVRLIFKFFANLPEVVVADRALRDIYSENRQSVYLSLRWQTAISPVERLLEA